MKARFRCKRHSLRSSVLAIILCLCMMTEPVMATGNEGAEGQPTPAPVPEATAGDILADAGDFEDIDYNITTKTDWRWDKTKYVGVATVIDDASKMSPAKGKYLQIVGSGLDSDSDGKPDQPVIKWKSALEVEAGATYQFSMYLRRNSDYWPSIALQEQDSSGTKIKTITLYTQPDKEVDANDGAVVNSSTEQGVWLELPYTYVPSENTKQITLTIYGGKYAADVSFDIDGISIVKEKVSGGGNGGEPTPAPVPEATAGDILADAGDFEDIDYNITTKTDWRWDKTKYVGVATVIDDASKMSPAKGKYLQIVGSGLDSDSDGKPDQPVIKWKSALEVEAGATYQFSMYLRRNSDYWPSIALQEQDSSGTKIKTITLYTQPDKEVDANDGAVVNSSTEQGAWLELPYTYVPSENTKQITLTIYGGKYAADISFDIDGISIVKETVSGGGNGGTGGEDDPLNRFDILEGNGGFEEGVTFDNTSGGKSGTWNHMTAGSYGSVVEIREGADAKYGSKYLYMAESADGSIQPRVMYKNNPYIIEGGKTYTLEFWFKRLNDACEPYISIQDRKGSDALQDVVDVYFVTEGGAETNTWIKVTKEFTTHEGSDRIRLSIRCGGDTEFCIDGIKVLKTPEALDLAQMEWEAKLASEAAESKTVIRDDGSALEYKEKLEGTPDNLLVNGDFASGQEHWKGNGATEDAQSYSWQLNGRDGVNDGCICINDNLTNKHPAVGQQVYNIVGGAEYQVTMWYKIDSTDITADPFVDVESYAVATDPGDDGYLGGMESRVEEAEFIRDGQWHQYVFRGRVPQRAEYCTVWIRKTKTGGSICLDDVIFTMTDASAIVSLNENMKFFYSDMECTTFEASVPITYYPDYADGSVVFEVYDGQNLIWKSNEVPLADGKAAVDFELSMLMSLAEPLDKPYCVIATLSDEGAVKGATSKNIYLYDRPSAINENGEYVKFNTVDTTFVPVLGYHVFNNDAVQHYDEVAAAGINVVQLPNNLTPDGVVEHLDALHALGMKGMVCLYPGDLPAGNPANVRTTIAKASDIRIQNHPAMFGYNIADEPFIDQLDPKPDLENSYRLIRQYDKNNVIMFVEDLEYNIPVASAYADALILDPYFGAAGATVYNIVTKAVPDLNFQKPLWIVMSTYIHRVNPVGYFNTADDVRNNNYQALLGGTDGVGYYAISDPGNNYVDELIADNPAWEGLVHSKNEGYIPVWEVKTPTNANAGAEVWEAITTFGTVEASVVGTYFVGNKGTKISEDMDIDAGYIYHAWVAEDGKNYLVVLNVKGAELHVDIPIIGASARILAGRKEDTKLYEVKDGLLGLDLVNVEALLLEITDIPVTEETEYKLGTGERETIRIAADKLDGVAVNDTLLIENIDYTIDAEKQELIFTEAYVEALLPGTYNVTLVYGNNEVVLTLEIAAEELSITSGKSDLEYQKGDTSAIIYCTGDISRFRELRKDGIEVAASNYEVESGSTIITFKRSYLESLSDGEHEFELVYRDGSVQAKIRVSTPGANESQEGGNSSENSTNTDNGGTDNNEGSNVSDSTVSGGTASGTAAPTGDNSRLVIWMVFMLGCAVVLVSVLRRRHQK